LKREAKDKKDEGDERIILFTEITSKMLNPRIDKKLASVYKSVLFNLTKAFSQNEDLLKFIKGTYKELLKNYL